MWSFKASRFFLVSPHFSSNSRGEHFYFIKNGETVVIMTSTMPKTTITGMSMTTSKGLIFFTVMNRHNIHFREWCWTNRVHGFVHQGAILKISSEYFVNPRSRYCWWKSMLLTGNVEFVFSNISLSVIFSPHNFSGDVILNIAKLYLLSLL